MTLRVGSTFSGIGGIDLGLDRAGMRTVWQCEIDPKASAVLARHWPDVHREKDIRDVDRSRVPGCDVLAGGFPCQDLSVAGRRAGLAGKRSGLFYEFARVASELAPTWVLIENVPGLLSSNDGRDMGAVLGTLAELGYGWAYRVLDAQYFGVAQRRRRVFIVGCLGDARRAAQVLLEPESCDGNPAPSRPEGKGVAALTAGGVGTCGADDNQAQAGHLIARREDGAELEMGEANVYNALRAGDGGSTRANYVLAFHPTQDPIDEEDLAPSLGTTSGGMGVLAFDHKVTGHPTASMPIEQGLSPTMTHDKIALLLPKQARCHQVRRLTPVECERLQGFPDDWTAGQSDAARYRQLGNAVAVPVIEWIGRRMVAA